MRTQTCPTCSFTLGSPLNHPSLSFPCSMHCTGMDMGSFSTAPIGVVSACGSLSSTGANRPSTFYHSTNLYNLKAALAFQDAGFRVPHGSGGCLGSGIYCRTTLIKTFDRNRRTYKRHYRSLSPRTIPALASECLFHLNDTPVRFVQKI